MAGAAALQWLDTELGRIAIASDGPQGGVPLLLLQRFRGTLDDWDPDFIAAIAANRRVIRFDSLGIGRSGGQVPETISGMAGVAAHLIRALGIEQVDILGWSLGGAVGQQLALDWPALVRRLVVAGSSPGTITEGPQPHPRVAQVMTKPANGPEDFLFLFYPETDSAIAAGRASLGRIAGQPDRGPPVTAEALMAQVRAIAAWPGVLHRATELRMPLLVANGAHDVMLPAYRSFVLSQQAPDAKLVLYPGAGHAFLFQEIDDFAAQLDLFLA
ncbi:alpha/beta fold hydrolase [Roseomonas fluvialis]|uniref:Alpha/beta hydrolase n=1 Tax=Roseomonas fluvialis TaxID=1750527 RepID=A0ABN6P6N1_9PROT|nr:alpha/beta hydrolase [Roseomonas fluvialis]BDG74354.1 alpha/beta hydrolase [Roseomonas fluvialis]